MFLKKATYLRIHVGRKKKDEKIIELNNVNVPKSGRRNAEMNLSRNLKRTRVNLLLVWWKIETAVIGDYDYSISIVLCCDGKIVCQFSPFRSI